MNLKQCYEILEIDETASLPKIKQAYRDMIGIWHPDRHIQNPRLYAKATEKLKALNAAYNELITRMTKDVVSKASNPEGSPNNKPYILIVTCPNCHQKNRLKAGFVKHHPRCGICGSLLYQKGEDSIKAEKKSEKTTQNPLKNSKTTNQNRSYSFGPKASYSQIDETIFHKSAKQKRVLNKWTLVTTLAIILLIANNFSELKSWLIKHLDAITENRYAQYLENPIVSVRTKLDNKNGAAASAAIQKLLVEAGYPVETAADAADEGIRTALKKFRNDYFLSFRVGDNTESTQALLRQRAIVRRQPNWPQIAAAPQFKEWIDHQNLTSPEICRQILTTGEVAQVVSLLDWYRFEQLNPKPQPLPRMGVLQKKYHKGLAPLTIRTRNDGRHYYLKLIDVAESTIMLTAFIRGGTNFVEHVPVGKYRLKYAVGQHWYGSRWLFGPDTVFKEMDQVFEFKVQNNQISGYQLDLYLQPVGLASTPKKYTFDF